MSKIRTIPSLPWSERPEYCPCIDDETHPVCPACPATVAGNDPVNGVCQARRSGRPPYPLVEIILVRRDLTTPNTTLDEQERAA
jgi:hypothetical protein